MNVSLRFPLALAMALAVGAAWAQAPAPEGAASAAKMRNCEKARHDHGADKGMPTPKSARCAAEDASGKPVNKPHDHAKVHK